MGLLKMPKNPRKKRRRLSAAHRRKIAQGVRRAMRRKQREEAELRREAVRRRRSEAAKRAWAQRKIRELEKFRRRSEAAKRAWEKRRERMAPPSMPRELSFLSFPAPPEAFLEAGDPDTGRAFDFAQGKEQVTVTVEFDHHETGRVFTTDITYDIDPDATEDEFRRMHNDAIREWLEELEDSDDVAYDSGSLWITKFH